MLMDKPANLVSASKLSVQGISKWYKTPTATVHALSSDRAIEPVDEYACRWDDPGLGFAWSPHDPVLSVRDALAGSLNALRTSVAAAIG